jgi:uncharacterized protein (TIGR02001 family)
MKTKNLVTALALSAAAVPATSMAEVTANAGWVSEYIFRGIFQESSSAYAGVDFATDSGFYLGTWGADVGQGLETDLYFGFAGGENFTYKIGYTGYFYTDDFDDTYQEVNLGIGYGIFALDVAIGEWDGFGTKQDYDFTSITISPEKGPYYKIGMWGGDFEDNVLFPNPKVSPLESGSADYFELGYTYSVEEHGVDLSVAYIYSPDLVVGDWDDGETAGDNAIVFGIKKNFSFGGE